MPKYLWFLSPGQFSLHFSRHDLGYSSFWSVLVVMFVNRWTYFGSLPAGRGKTVVVATVGDEGAIVTADGVGNFVVASGAMKTCIN